MANRIITLLAALCLTPAFGVATYPGSVISSFFAPQIPGEGYPQGVTFGDGYVWIDYPWGLVTKRKPNNGSIISSFRLEYGEVALSAAWEKTDKYFYNLSNYGLVVWSDSTTGSAVGSFPFPPGHPTPTGVEYDDTTPAKPVWLADFSPPAVLNLTASGSVVKSFDLGSWPYKPWAVAYDGDTAGGPYLFVGTWGGAAPALVYVVRPNNFSIITSFVAPVQPGSLLDLSWDGTYLWALQNAPGVTGWVYRFVAHAFAAAEPASLGKVKALFR